MSYLQARTSYWDFLPPEIQQYILKLVDRQHHRDQLSQVHQVLNRFWQLCNCGPFHLLKELHFSRKWKVTCGIRAFLRKQPSHLQVSNLLSKISLTTAPLGATKFTKAMTNFSFSDVEQTLGYLSLWSFSCAARDSVLSTTKHTCDGGDA